MKVTFIIYALVLIFSFGQATNSSNISAEKISTLLKTFHVNHPIIQNSLLSKINLKNVIKGLSFHGHSIGFNENSIHYYQSLIIFTKIQNFNWTIRTNAPVLVVSNIQNEKYLGNIKVSIRDEILFYDWTSEKVYEAYTINNIQVIRHLGHVVQDNIYCLIKRIKF